METIIGGFLTVILFWILFGIGKLLVRKKESPHKLAIPLTSLTLVLIIGMIIDRFLGVQIFFPAQILNIIKLRTTHQVEKLLSTCQVKAYYQLHSNSYTIKLKDNSVIYLPKFLENKENNLQDLVKANQDKCGPILFGIE